MCLEDVSGSYCAFPDQSCDSKMRWDASAERSMTCVSRQVLIGGPTDAPGVVENERKRAGQPCGPCMLGRYELRGDQVVCGGVLIEEVTNAGEPSAEGCKDEQCDAGAAVDKDLTTSWFSRGAQLDPRPPFRWESKELLCLTSIELTGNGKHTDEKYRSGYGFFRVIVQVIDDRDVTRVSDRMDYPQGSTPVEHSLGGVWGKKVQLLLVQHEDAQCGGFSELSVFAARAVEAK
jgi:hypothetical protein